MSDKTIVKRVRANDGGTVFPLEGVSEGLTLREFLTGCALAGGCGFDLSEGSVKNSQLAFHAVSIADATIAQLREPAEILVEACEHGVEVDLDTGVADACPQCGERFPEPTVNNEVV